MKVIQEKRKKLIQQRQEILAIQVNVEDLENELQILQSWISFIEYIWIIIHLIGISIHLF